MAQHSIKLGIDWADDDNFYHDYYNKPLIEYVPVIHEDDDDTELEIYITSFGDPIYISYQIKMLNYFLIGKVNYRIIVFDTNSHINPQESDYLQYMCYSLHTTYAKMPHNKFQDMDQLSFKLGTDMNYIWRNFTKKTRPKYFGFLDQDCFLIRDSWDCIKDFLDKKGIYGLAWPQDPGYKNHEHWLVHIMQNFFRYDFVENIDLDFRPAGHIGLDTGGCNWFTLFRHLKREDYLQNEAEMPGPWLDVFRHFSLHDHNRWLHIRNSTKQYTGHSNEMCMKIAHATGILEGILLNDKQNKINNQLTI